MLNQTIEIVRVALGADPTLSPAERTQKLTTLRNGEPPRERAELLRVIRFKEVAKLLGKDVRTVHSLCEQGVLKKAKFPGRTRASGVSRDSFENFLSTLEK